MTCSDRYPWSAMHTVLLKDSIKDKIAQESVQMISIRSKRRLKRRRCFEQGRPGRNRTRNPRFWRPVLCQIELLAYFLRILSTCLSITYQIH